MEKKGFTLIELLVVIAIIGILASIVLVSLGNARNKAKDVRIKAAIAQIRSQAEIFYDDHSYSYAGFCIDPSIDLLEADITTMGGTLVCFEIAGTSYCASSVLSDATIICMDSTGKIGAAACALGVCP